MRNCTACQNELPENARFCPQCGEKVFEETLTCPDCGAENGINSKFCFHCGVKFFSTETPPQLELELDPTPTSSDDPKNEIEFELDLNPPPTEELELEPEIEEIEPEPVISDLFEEDAETIQKKIFGQFMMAFKERIELEHNPNNHQKYVDYFNESDFKKGFDYRVKQLSEEILKLRESTLDQAKEEAILQRAFDESLDYFIIHYCKHLNEIDLPESILKYQNANIEEVDLAQMILDYLDFESEEETVYLDFITMPIQKLKNAGKSFLFPEKDEKILFICDQSVLGSCKEGFAMTEQGLYWKAIFEKPNQVLYRDIKEVKRQEDWITINGKFFNVNHSLNLKLLKLLKKLKSMMTE
jgi:hypothetical protein